MLPFTAEAYSALVAQYHSAIWPVQVLGVALLAAGLGLIIQGRRADWIMAAKVAVAWAWTGIAFFWVYFSTISFFAPALAVLFVVQVALLLWLGRQPYGSARGLSGWCGICLMALSLAGAPLIGRLAGLDWNAVPLAGTSPTPTAVFTLGLLLTAEKPPIVPALIPALWLAADAWASWVLDDSAGLILPAMGFLGILLLAVRRAAPD